MRGKVVSNSEWKKAFFFLRDPWPWSWNLSSKKDKDQKESLSDLERETIVGLERMLKRGKLLCFKEIVSNDNLKKHGLMPCGLGATSSSIYF